MWEVIKFVAYQKRVQTMTYYSIFRFFDNILRLFLSSSINNFAQRIAISTSQADKKTKIISSIAMNIFVSKVF